MRPIPDELISRPFSRAEARTHGLTDRMLNARRFVRLLPRVYRHRDHEMTDDDWIAAARLALPERALLTGLTHIQQLGLDYGPRWPLRFVVEGDHHLAFERIFVHRTKRLPPHDGTSVAAAAAFISYCRRARVIDAIKVGDWLLHQQHMTIDELRDLALAEQWRDGADEALWLLDHLDADSRSLPESECRALLAFAGLPIGEANRRLVIEDDIRIIGDLVFEQWRTVVEYEGSHHQEDRGQYSRDIERYALMRRHDIGYVQVTREKLAHARTMVGEVYRELVSHGYDGPAPFFGPTWQTLFHRITDVLGPRRDRRRGLGA